MQNMHDLRACLWTPRLCSLLVHFPLLPLRSGGFWKARDFWEAIAFFRSLNAELTRVSQEHNIFANAKEYAQYAPSSAEEYRNQGTLTPIQDYIASFAS